MLPTVPLGTHRVSRLVIGGNIFSGTSHLSPEADRDMEDYYTTANIKKALFRSEECGINTMALRGDKHIFRLIREYRQDGGTLQWIAQTAPEMVSFQGNVNQIMSYRPIAVYHHGTQTDALAKAGRWEELNEHLKILRDTGAQVGLCTHMPDVVEYAEEHGWDVDYYMTCLYNLSRVERVSSAVTGKMVNDEPFFEEDRRRMYQTIRQTEKPCHVFKILGAGRRCDSPESVRAAYEDTFANIKPIDLVIVGMFQKYMDQIGAGAALVREICARGSNE